MLCCQDVNTESTFSPVTDQAVTPRRTIVSKGQSHVLVEELEILKAQNVELSCHMTDIPSKPLNITGYWRKNADEIENSRQTVQRHSEQYILHRTFNIQTGDLGNYSCIFSYLGKEEQATFVLKVPTMKEKRDRPIVSYVGDSVVMECAIKPAPNTWKWYKTNGTEKEFISDTADPLNYKILLAKNVTKLTVLNLTEEDSGKYTCSAVYDIAHSESHMQLRVLSFTEPLKPFLAIAAEVAILVTLILLYERYSRSRNDHATITESSLNSEQMGTLTEQESNGVDGGTTTRQRKGEK
ncbi:embigin [Trichomycterus rosablanca]|uniref:embigin n=1 Tax=Trichomycterus rosablanca TaxID=2290929 RepID=UPI002F35DEBA